MKKRGLIKVRVTGYRLLVTGVIGLIGLIGSIGKAYALPAKPGPVVVTEADGTEHTVYLHGDEFFHYMTAADGRWLEMQEGKLHQVQGLTDEEVAERREAERTRRIPKRVIAATQQAQPLNIAPRGLIILAAFSDREFRAANTLEAFRDMFDGENYSFNGATGSARKYFEDQSFGAYKPVFDVVGPVTVSNTQSYYGENDRSGSDKHPDELIIEACQIADTAFNVDFSIYDNNNDGFVDFVYVIYAGRGEADGGGSNTIWPHTSWIHQAYGKNVYVDGKRLDTYACSSELQSSAGYLTRDGIGAFCHEFGHALGLPDHYATNYSTVKQTGDWDLMCHGSYNNASNTPAGYTAYERFFVGWITPTILNTATTVDSMKPLNTSGEAYIITETGESNLVGNNPDPVLFYMLENRQKTGWDGYVPGRGLLITRVHYNYQKWVQNIVNNSATARGYEIIEADGKEPERYEEGWEGKQGDVFPYGDVNSFTPFEGYPITGIQQNEGGTIRFHFMGGNDYPSFVVKETAAEKYGADYNEVVAVYDIMGRLVTTDTQLNKLPQGIYIVAVSNGTKQKGVKLAIR